MAIDMLDIRKILIRMIYPEILNKNVELKHMYDYTYKELMIQQKINKEIRNRNVTLKTDMQKLRKYNDKLTLDIYLLKEKVRK